MADIEKVQSTELAIWQDKGRMDVIRQAICVGHTDIQIRFFLEYCQSKGFDPFSRMIYSTIRQGKQVFQTGIDGMRSQAETSKLYRGQLGPFWCGQDGVWKDIWLDETTPPVAAKVGVLREDFSEPMWAIAKWKEFKPSEDWMWKKMPSNQLAKCAEALALRKAFPEKLAGLYSDDEMAQAGPATKTIKGKDYHEEGPKLPGQCGTCGESATSSDEYALACDKHKHTLGKSSAAVATEAGTLSPRPTPPAAPQTSSQPGDDLHPTAQDMPQDAPGSPGMTQDDDEWLGVPPETPETPQAKRAATDIGPFMEHMERAKKDFPEGVGEVKYREILRSFGFENKAAVKSKAGRDKVLRKMIETFQDMKLAPVQAAPPDAWTAQMLALSNKDPKAFREKMDYLGYPGVGAVQIEYRQGVLEAMRLVIR